MTITPKTKKILWVVVPVLGASAFFAIWYYFFNKPKPVYVSNNNPSSTPPKTAAPVRSSSAGQFPLQQGSKNNSVKTLQQALGITADGSFGPATLLALQNQYGVSAVPDQNTLTAIVSAAGGQGQAVRATAQGLYSQSLTGQYDLQVNTTTFAESVTMDDNGNLTPSGTGFTMTVGQVYDNSAYILDGVSVLGQLILRVASGPLQGEYTFDPNAIGLVQHGTFGVLPSTNEQTGLTTLPTF